MAEVRERRWMKPNKRAAGYAKDRKEGVHTYGDKEGTPLTEYEKGIRSGYLLCQSDHAGMYRYKKARAEGKSPKEAGIFSRIIGVFKKDNAAEKEATKDAKKESKKK